MNKILPRKIDRIRYRNYLLRIPKQYIYHLYENHENLILY